MANINADAIFTTSTGAYKWAGFVVATISGNGVVDSLIIPNEMFGKRDPDYVRIQIPVDYNQGEPAAPPAGLGAWAQFDIAAPDWHTADDAVAGTNAIWLAVTDAAPGGQHVFFVEFGVEHSVDK